MKMKSKLTWFLIFVIIIAVFVVIFLVTKGSFNSSTSLKRVEFNNTTYEYNDFSKTDAMLGGEKEIQ